MDNGNKLYDVKVTDAAWVQLVEHSRFLANVSTEAANRLVDEFIEKTGTLNHMPERCAWLDQDDVPFQKYRKISFGKYHLGSVYKYT